MYEKLFSKIKINGCTIPNRIVLGPMDDALGQASGELTPRAIEYYTAKAAGGTGLVIVAYVCAVGPELSGVSITGQAHLRTLDHRHAFGTLADRIHEHGSKVFVQLMHPGRKSVPKYNNGNMPVSSSAMPPEVVGKMAPARELTVEEIHEIEDKFATAAEHAYFAGIDGVELHCAHFYLFNQFISPVRNVRTDEYGGSMENRCRIVVETVQKIRQKVPKDWPVTVRLHAWDGEGFPSDMSCEDLIEVAKHLIANGVDAIDYSCGAAERTGYPELETGWRNDYYRRIKEEIKVPIYGPNETKHPDDAEKFLQEGLCDLVFLGRPLSADPEWGNKAKECRPEDIRPCLSCNYCVFNCIGNEAQIRCAVNPTLGREVDYLRPMPKGTGTVVVIGAGPGGIQAALNLADRGYKVVLCDNNSEIGGALNLANKAPKKFRMDALINYYKVQINKNTNIEVRLNYEVNEDTIEELKALNPHAVVLACGGDPIVPPFPGSEKTVTANDVLSGKVKVEGKKVVVVGGGMTGLETAHKMAADGNAVTVVEKLPTVGIGIYYYNVVAIKRHLAELGVDLKVGTSIVEVKDGTVVVEPCEATLPPSVMTVMQNASGISVLERPDDGHDAPYEIECDVCVLAMGVKKKLELEPLLDANFENVVAVGDCALPGNIAGATSAAYIATRNL